MSEKWICEVKGRNPEMRMSSDFPGKMAIESLDFKQLRWIPLTERMPTKEDSIEDINKDPKVLFYYHGNQFNNGIAMRHFNLLDDISEEEKANWSFIPMSYLPEYPQIAQ